MSEEVVIVSDSNGKGYGFAKGVYDYVRGKPERDFKISEANIIREVHPDGEHKLRISNNIRRKSCIYIQDSNTEPRGWFFDLGIILDALQYSSPKEINVVLPCMRYQRQDRKSESRVGVSAKAVASLISRYADRGLAVDLHAPQIQQFFDIPFDNLYSFPVLVEHLKENHSYLLENLVVVSPDAGGVKRVESLLHRFGREGIEANIAVGYKRKVSDRVEEVIIMGDVKGKNCLVVDDILDTGGTMIKTAKSLRNGNCNKLFAYGTHGLFSGVKINKFKSFDKILVSDTFYNKISENLEVVSLVDLLGEAVYRTIVGKSLSSLFN